MSTTTTTKARRIDYAALIEDVEWLIETREHPAMIAARTGFTTPALHQALRRAGRRDLATYFNVEQRATYPREHNNTGRDTRTTTRGTAA
ncbi:hypothetical protein [Ornithinimicrobium cerasi]|uniref:hypothetical protein n=1 Tax=Ornithinimicrobium cerasi TaxID=2248773 RepID=UPI000F00A183|nr:hypothetical protein [Ornithinimicrobium cerasi]